MRLSLPPQGCLLCNPHGSAPSQPLSSLLVPQHWLPEPSLQSPRAFLPSGCHPPSSLSGPLNASPGPTHRWGPLLYVAVQGKTDFSTCHLVLQKIHSLQLQLVLVGLTRPLSLSLLLQTRPPLPKPWCDHLPHRPLQLRVPLNL